MRRRAAAGPVLGLPTTLRLDTAGCVVGTLAGRAGWASEEAKRVGGGDDT